MMQKPVGHLLIVNSIFARYTIGMCVYECLERRGAAIALGLPGTLPALARPLHTYAY